MLKNRGGIYYMSISVIFGSCTADPRVLDKTGYFSAGVSIPCQIKEACSVMHPEIIVSSSLAELATYNYCSIPAFGRYYYITDMITLTGGRVSVRCKEDVLTSHKADILQCTGYLVRTDSEDLRNKYLKDNHIPTQERRQEYTYTFNKTPFTANYGTDSTYLLAVMGGNHSV